MSPLLGSMLTFALPLLLLIGGAIAVSVYKNHDAPLSVAVIGAGIFSFIFFYTRSGSQPVGVQPEGGLGSNRSSHNH